MKQIVIARPGGYDRLQLVERPDPQPGPGEVAIDVQAIGVNFADCITRMGLYSSARKYVGYPITPGFEVAGLVATVGEGVSDLHPGDRVIGLTRFNGYSSRLVLPSKQVFPLPPGVDVREGAAFPTVFLTAWYALSHLARPSVGATVLIHSAAGGVGSALLQLAQVADCRTVGVVGGSHKVETAKALGAEAVIDRSSQDLWGEAKRLAPHGYEAIFDASGVATLKQSYRHLAPTGRLVVYGFHSMLGKHGGRPGYLQLAWNYLRTPRFSPFHMTSANRSVMGFNLSYLFDRSDLLQEGMTQLLDSLKNGDIRLPPVTSYPMERVADAHRDLEAGGTVGKLVLTT